MSKTEERDLLRDYESWIMGKNFTTRETGIDEYICQKHNIINRLSDAQPNVSEYLLCSWEIYSEYLSELGHLVLDSKKEIPDIRFNEIELIPTNQIKEFKFI
jgi:hypothetical protein